MKLNKKQKRTATIASMAALLAVVLGMGGQTFAKYISTKSYSETATVAKWGIVVNVDGTGLFGTDYTGGAIVNSNGAGVSSASTVIAPGTSGSVSFKISGQSQVSSKVTVALTTTEVCLYASDSDNYYPIKYKLNNGSSDVATGTAADINTYFADNLNKEYSPNAAAFAYNYTLTWSWAFESGNDELDTQLGLLIAAENEADDEKKAAMLAVVEDKYEGSSETTYSFGLAVTVEQTNK